jgi:hypothetical protein
MATNHTITDFKSGFNGGTRANRFAVKITFPDAITANKPTTTVYHAMAAKLPESDLGSISVPYRGRVAHYAGDRDYKPWTVTFVDDTGTNATWYAFQKWADLLSSHPNNTVTDQTYAADNLLCDVDFLQLHDPTATTATYAGVVVPHDGIRRITLKHAWPSEVGQIGLDMGEGGSLVSFPVTFTFDYYEIVGGL